MSSRSVWFFSRVLWGLFTLSLPVEVALAASGNCTGLGQLPAVLELSLVRRD